MTGTETDPGFEQDGPDSAAERLAAALNPAPETAGDAVQWFRNGDHPDDDCHMVTPDPSSLTQFAPFLSEGKVVRYFRRPDIPGTSTCPRCARTMHDHGWIDRGPEGITVCPGDWVAPDGSGGYRRVVPLADLLRGASPDEGPHEDGWLDQLAAASLSAMKAKYPDGEGTAAPDPRGGIPSEPDPADAPEGHAGPNGAGSAQDGPGAAGSVLGDPGAAEVHVDWRMTPAEWDELREALMCRPDVPYIARLISEGKLPKLWVPASDDPAPADPPLPDGAYGRIELPGYRNHTGWVTEETEALDDDDADLYEDGAPW